MEQFQLNTHQEERWSYTCLRNVYENAFVISSGKHLTTVNELCDQVPAMRPEVLEAAVEEALQFGTFGANKILTEEDKGAPIASVASLRARLPLCMARWYPYTIPNQITVDLKSEYFTGPLYMNGVQKGDKIFIIEDTLSTGGTMIALIEAVRASGAEVVGAVAVIEKDGNDGHDNVWIKTGIDVKTCLKIQVTAHNVRVIA